MFRTLFKRPPAVKVPAQNGGVEMQRIEIRRQPSKASGAVRRFAINTILFYCAFHTVKFWIYGPDPEVQKRYEELRKQKALQRSKEKPSEHWQQQHSAISPKIGDPASDKQEEKTDRIVIPIYGWMKQLEPRKPSPNDPDLRAFTALRNDERAVQKLHGEIYQTVLKQMRNSKAHSRNFNMIKPDGRYKRNLHFGQMIRPPPYAMRCLILEPGRTALGWRELSPADGARIQRLQQPLLLTRAFFKGLWAFTTTTSALTQAKFLDTVYGSKIWPYEFLYRTQQGNTRFIGSVNPMSREEVVISKLPSNNMTDEQVKKIFPFLKGSFGQGSTKDAFRSTTQSFMQDSVLQHAVHVFKAHVMAGQHQAQAISTPGTVPIVGYFDFMGSHGIYRVEVMALYVVREHSFIPPIMITSSKFLYNPPESKQLSQFSSKANQSHQAAAVATTQSQPSKQADGEPESETPEKDSSPGKDIGK